MSRGRRRRGFKVADAGSKSRSRTLKFEDYEKVFIAPLLSLILGIATYACKKYWDKFPEVAFYETVVVAACLAGVFVTLLYLPLLLYNVFTSKRFAIIVFLLFLVATTTVIVPITQLLWRQFTNKNQTDFEVTSTDSTHFDKIVTVDNTKLSSMEVQENTENSTDGAEGQEQLSHAVNGNVKFNGDCLRYSQQLLSQPNVLQYPRKYHIHSQVEMLQRTVLLKGKPTFLVFADDSDPPSEFEGDALDLSNRHNNAGAQSSVSVYDAVEKALALLCKNLFRQGIGDIEESGS